MAMKQWWVLLLIVAVQGCADRLALRAPTGVDLSGTWHLNKADSDDPINVMQSQMAALGAGAPGFPPGGGPPGGRPPPGGFAGGAPVGPRIDPAALQRALNWPRETLVIRQQDASIEFDSDGQQRLLRPASRPCVSVPTPRGVVAASCGWSQRSLVIKAESRRRSAPIEKYALSEDGRRLIQTLLLKGGPGGELKLTRSFDAVR